MTTPPSIDRLALLYQLSQTFNSSLDLDEVLNRVMDEVIVATRAERGFVMLQEEGRAGPRLVFRAARGIEQKTIDDPQFQISRSLVERVASEGRPVLTSDAQSDARFSMRQSVVILGLRSILCVPLKIKDRILGVIYVDNRLQAGIFTQADLELLTAIASSASIAIENARLYQVAVEKGRMERELQVARQVQASFLPAESPELPGWEFVARWLPARQVAGDFYDFIPREDGTLGVVIADVTDKGMPAALFMAVSRSLIRASVDRAASPVEGIAQANRLISSVSTSNMFVTVFYALVDPERRQVTYVNCGHNPPLLVRPTASGSPELIKLTRTGMPLGIEPDSAYGQSVVQLQPGDLIFFYTDGVTDALSESQAHYGMERLQGVLLASQGRPAADVMDALVEDLRQFTGDAPVFDDITIVAARLI